MSGLGPRSPGTPHSLGLAAPKAELRGEPTAHQLGYLGKSLTPLGLGFQT